jgi:hypothetical protein
MMRPVWLLSLDTDQFCAPPLTTGALKAHFVARGRTAATTDVELVHFPHAEDVHAWLDGAWRREGAGRARAAVAAGLEPVVGLSCYTWNVAEFLVAARRVKADAPGTLVVAGGPHVQRAEDFLTDEAIDVIALGEGEETLTELLDTPGRAWWAAVNGLAWLGDDGAVVRTPSRARAVDLDRNPSALDVVELRNPDGTARYRQVAYETSRGCPYRCAFCEWGTGAIGTKIFQLSLPRIRRDLEALIEGGVQDIWFCDSNFGALREDLHKAEIVVELRQKSGRPQTFATSWSKNHNARVREIVRLMHRNGLLWHYHLALQTLTPRALERCHRTNMRANDYEPVVKALAAEGVPVTAELMWPLPGDTLAEFATSLDHLFTIFPAINIFAYTLLPGTEYYDRRAEFAIEAIPVAGYGKAKGEYVVACDTFSRAEGEEGYLLVAAHVMLSRGHVLPLTLRLLALDGRVSVSGLLREVLVALVSDLGEPHLPHMSYYEERARLYLALLASPARTFTVLRETILARCRAAGAGDLCERASRVLELDALCCPRTGPGCTLEVELEFAADRVMAALGSMVLPESEAFAPGEAVVLEIQHPGHVGEVLIDPDGGAWMRGRVEVVRRRASASAPLSDADLDAPLEDVAGAVLPAVGDVRDDVVEQESDFGIQVPVEPRRAVQHLATAHAPRGEVEVRDAGRHLEGAPPGPVETEVGVRPGAVEEPRAGVVGAVLAGEEPASEEVRAPEDALAALDVGDE